MIAALRRLLEQRRALPPAALVAAELLDLVALGTVADVVPFDANNRILVAQGLARIRAGRCVPGITALLEVARRSPADPGGVGSGFRGGAATQRRRPADRHVDRDPMPAERCAPTRRVAAAHELDALNTQRRQIEASMQTQALAAVRVLGDPGSGVTRAGVCLFDAGWHQGVVGLVASRVKERVRRPVIAFARVDATTLRGSARSIPGIHVRDLLDAIAARNPQLIQKFGGHAMAAGVTLQAAQLDQFAAAFDAECGAALARSGLARCDRNRWRARGGELALPLARRCAPAARGARVFPSRCSTACFASSRRVWSASAI